MTLGPWIHLDLLIPITKEGVIDEWPLNEGDCVRINRGGKASLLFPSRSSPLGIFFQRLIQNALSRRVAQ